MKSDHQILTRLAAERDASAERQREEILAAAKQVTPLQAQRVAHAITAVLAAEGVEPRDRFELMKAREAIQKYRGEETI